MIKITKEEYEKIRKTIPSARTVILNKQSSHKKRLVETSLPVLKLLSDIRGYEVTSDDGLI